MKAFILILTFLLLPTMVFSQSDSSNKKVYYATVVREKGHDKKKILFDVTDSSVMLMDKRNDSIHTVSYRQIEKITIRRKGHTGTSIAVAALGGVAVATIMGFVAKDSYIYFPTADPEGVIVVIGIGLIGGAIFGVLYGLSPTKMIIINHDALKFSNAVNQLKSYCRK